MGNGPSTLLRKVQKHDHHDDRKSSGNEDGESPDSDSSSVNGRKQHRKHQTSALLTLFEKLELTADGDNAHPGELTKATFENAFHGPLHKFGKLMYLQMVTASATTNRERITREQFVKAGKEILKLYDEKNLIKFYFHLFASGKDHLTVEDAKQMFEISFALTLSLSQILSKEDPRDGQVLTAMVTGLFGICTELKLEPFTKWVQASCPLLFHCVHNWVVHVMTGSALPDEMEMARVPQLDGVTSSSSTVSVAALWLLSLTLPAVYTKQKDPPLATGMGQDGAAGQGATRDPMLTSMLLLRKMARLPHCQGWKLLYSSDNHGMSMNRFNHHVTSYQAPNVMLLSFEGRNFYCLAVDTGWVEGPSKFGGADCRLVQLLPVFRVVQAGDKMVRWNERSRDLPKGISVGCEGKTEVIRLPSDFDKIIHYSVPCSLHRIEVWGCGAEEVLLSQQRQKQWEKGQVQREQSRKLKLHGESWDDTPDKQLLQWGGVDVGNHSYSQ